MPSVNINPNEKIESESTSTVSSSSHQSKQNKIENMRNEENNEDSDGFDVNQQGTGIHLPGYIKPNSNNNNFDRNAMINPNSNLINDKNINQLSNETNQLAKTRDFLENKTFNWLLFLISILKYLNLINIISFKLLFRLEQEMMARFISRLANTEEHVHDEDYQYGEFDEESEKNDPIEIREADLSKKIFSLKN